MTFMTWFLAWIGASVCGGIFVGEVWIRLRDSKFATEERDDDVG
jgi:uncharacterized membrane-anchored protein YhcB (DUF1043 family)